MVVSEKICSLLIYHCKVSKTTILSIIYKYIGKAQYEYIWNVLKIKCGLPGKVKSVDNGSSLYNVRFNRNNSLRSINWSSIINKTRLFLNGISTESPAEIEQTHIDMHIYCSIVLFPSSLQSPKAPFRQGDTKIQRL